MNNDKLPKIKPFPRICPICRERQVYPRVVSYATDVAHDGKLHRVVIKKLKTPFCVGCQTACPDLAANQQITVEFLRQAKLLTPEQIRNGREALKLTQKQLASYLGIAEATMSRWETGGQIQQRSLDNLLRIFFACPDVRRKLMEKKLTKIGFVPDEELASVASK